MHNQYGNQIQSAFLVDKINRNHTKIGVQQKHIFGFLPSVESLERIEIIEQREFAKELKRLQEARRRLVMETKSILGAPLFNYTY